MTSVVVNIASISVYCSLSRLFFCFVLSRTLALLARSMRVRLSAVFGCTETKGLGSRKAPCRICQKPKSDGSTQFFCPFPFIFGCCWIFPSLEVKRLSRTHACVVDGGALGDELSRCKNSAFFNETIGTRGFAGMG